MLSSCFSCQRGGQHIPSISGWTGTASAGGIRAPPWEHLFSLQGLRAFPHLPRLPTYLGAEFHFLVKPEQHFCLKQSCCAHLPSTFRSLLGSPQERPRDLRTDGAWLSALEGVHPHREFRSSREAADSPSAVDHLCAVTVNSVSGKHSCPEGATPASVLLHLCPGGLLPEGEDS